MEDFVKNNLLFEDVDSGRVQLAIKKRLPIKVNYIADNDPKGSGWRIIQPVAYGLSKSGNPVLRAYQPFGDTKTKVPHWKLFRLDRFETWKPIYKKTNIPEPPLDEYNPNGDKSMSTVYLNADYVGAKQRYEKGGLKKHNEKVRMQKVAQNPYYDLKKNIERAKRLQMPDYVQQNTQQWQNNKPSFMQNWLNGKTAEEMSNTTDFGDNNFVQTDEPIRKQNNIVQAKKPQIKKNDYTNIALNGAVSKQSEIEKSQLNTDNEIGDNDNNNDENINSQNGYKQNK